MTRSAGGSEGGDGNEIGEEERRKRASLSLKNNGDNFELEAAAMARVGLGVMPEFRG